MSYTTVEAAQLEPTPGPHPAASPYDKADGSELGVHAFGIYQVELPPGAEDVYAVIHGSGTVIVDGEAVPICPGKFIAVTPDSTRHVRAGNDGINFIAICATPPAPR